MIIGTKQGGTGPTYCAIPSSERRSRITVMLFPVKSARCACGVILARQLELRAGPNGCRRADTTSVCTATQLDVAASNLRTGGSTLTFSVATL